MSLVPAAGERRGARRRVVSGAAGRPVPHGLLGEVESVAAAEV
jgi:hypothetical protein